MTIERKGQQRPPKERCKIYLLVDLTGFHYHHRPNMPFISFDRESQEEDDRLKALSNVDKLIQDLSRKFQRPKREEIVVVGELHTVAQIESGQLVAVALQLAYASKGMQDGRWVAFAVEPDDYEELQAEVEAKVTEYRNHMENMIRGAESRTKMETKTENVNVDPDEKHILSATEKEAILQGCTFANEMNEGDCLDVPCNAYQQTT